MCGEHNRIPGRVFPAPRLCAGLGIPGGALAPGRAEAQGGRARGASGLSLGNSFETTDGGASNPGMNSNPVLAF